MAKKLREQLIAEVTSDVENLVDDFRGRGEPDAYWLREYAKSFNTLATVLDYANEMSSEDDE